MDPTDALSNSPTLPPATTRPRAERHLTPLPSLGAETDTRIETAIAASARAEASLSGLFRAIQSLDTGVDGAREANELLTHELEALHQTLGAAEQQHLAAKQSAALLEQALDRARKDTEKNRQFLIEQHDAFIVDLMNEQERELARRDSELELLRDELNELREREARSRSDLPTLPPPHFGAPSGAPLEPQPDEGTVDRAARYELERATRKLVEDRERAREAVQRLQRQRDEAQTAVARITQERDEALEQVFRLKAELGGPRLVQSTRPPPPDSLRLDANHANQPSERTSASEAVASNIELPALVRTPQLEFDVSALQGTAEPTLPVPVMSVVTPPRSNPNAVTAPPRRPFTEPRPRLNVATSPPSPARSSSQPPEELRSALTSSPTMQPRAPSNRPPLKQKPDVSTRPLVGYSLGNAEVEQELLEGVRLSKPPAAKR